MKSPSSRLRDVLLFVTAILVALTAGRAFWVWLGESPIGMAGPTYVGFFQELDKRIAVPITIAGTLGPVFAAVSAVVMALPPEYEDVLRRWWNWHMVRLITSIGAMCCVLAGLTLCRSAVWDE